MPSRLLLCSVAFLLFSYALILALLYAWPSLPDQLSTSISPVLLNTSLAIAMTTVAGRASAFLTRPLPLKLGSFNSSHYLDLTPNFARSLHIHRLPHMVSSRSLSSTAKVSQSVGEGLKNTALPHLSLHIAASSSGKKRKFRPDLNTFDYQASNVDGLGVQKGGTIQEKRRSRPDSGQDAYFVARVGGGTKGNGTAFAIADGVGGWVDHGIDPADFSHGLCSHMANISLQSPGLESSSSSSSSNSTQLSLISPGDLLARGYAAVLSDPEIIGGGSTACVGVADDHGHLRIANLGDSGYVHLRLGTVYNYSDPQTHAFNTPYQLSLTPPHILRQTMIFGGSMLQDWPESADLSDHTLSHGDVLILATDGVWDNLDIQDILKIVTRVMRQAGAWRIDPTSKGYVVADQLCDLVKPGQTQGQTQGQKLRRTLQSVLAAELVAEAKVASTDAQRDGPFAKAVKREFPWERWTGGKVDDIAVLVLVPIAEPATEPEPGPELKAKL